MEIARGSTTEFKSFDTADVIRSHESIPADEIQAQAFKHAEAIQSQVYSLAGHLSKVNITLNPIYFDDGSQWVTGRYFKTAPPPQLWQEITPSQFFAGAPIPPQ